MATNNTTATLEGNFKRIYADNLENLIPDNAKLVKDVPFSSRKRLGDTYEQPVVLTNEAGMTYASAGDGAFSLNTPIAMATKNARVPSVQQLLRSRIDYESASKAVAGGDAAFRKTTDIVVKSMLESITHRLECSLLYGGVGIGVPSASTNASATSTVITISAASWAVGIWAGCENAQINVYDDGGIPIGNSDYSNADAIFTITAVDPDNKKITVSGTSTGISALDTAAADTAGDLDIYWYGSYGKDMNGIDKIITNTGSLFGISAATYNLWKGNSYAAGGAITLAKLLKSTTNAIGKGGLMEEVTCYINPVHFAVINAEMAAYRRFDSSYNKMKMENGFTELRVYAQNGLMRIVPHSMVKGGEAFILPINTIKRIGSTDVTFNNPGMGNKFFRELTDNAGFELRVYSDQAVFIEKPAKATKITGLTY